MTEKHADWKYIEANNTIKCTGAWTGYFCAEISTHPDLPQLPEDTTLIIDGGHVLLMDTSGAIALQKIVKQLTKQQCKIDFQGFAEDHMRLLKLISTKIDLLDNPPKPIRHNLFHRIGVDAMKHVHEGLGFLSFVGELTIVTFRTLGKTTSLHWNLMLNTIDKTGYRALGIVGLLSLLIGVVLAYQMGLQLQSYGAGIYIVDLLGFSILREFGPLITAIIVAGRTASSFTAEIGTMKVNQEIDAMKTMGLAPSELIVLPKVIGLIIALPLLTVWADIFGMIGGMMMSRSMLSISYVDFLMRFHESVSLKQLLVGLAKAPIFALLIAAVGCFQGYQVEGSADSVGSHTTKSVVLAIFLIIIADALFSVIFSIQGL